LTLFKLMRQLIQVTLAAFAKCSRRVIGVNTAMSAERRAGLCNSRIETAQRVANQLITTGRVEHPYLGVRMVELTLISERK